MKNICILLSLAFAGCAVKNDSDLIQNPVTQISFTVEQSNVSKSFKSQVKNSYFVSQSSGVHRHSQKDSVYISRGKTYKLVLENNDTISMNLWFQKWESTKLLNLVDTFSSSFDQKWTYKSLENEKTFFYNKFDEVRLDFGSHALWYSKPNENFKINKVISVKEQGVEKNYIEISFSGMTYLWYPGPDNLPVYTITGGYFKGILN